MKNITAVTFIASCVICSCANAQQKITGFEAPESVIKTTKGIFVDNVGGAQPDPSAKDGNGFISKLNDDGTIAVKKFQKSVLNGPKGMAELDSVLYVADIDRVVGFDISGGQQVFELAINGAKFLNDLTSAGNSMLVVTDSFTGDVITVDPGSKEYKVVGHVPGANGVIYDATTQNIFVCGMGENQNGQGKLFSKNIMDSTKDFVELPASPTGVFDGLAMIDYDHLLVSDWVSFAGNVTKARLLVYSIKDKTTKEYAYEPGPADLWFDKSSGMLYVPQMLQGDIAVQKLSDLEK